jgi:ABC-type Fe3+/spermidine/putrescine transport system ATPase subunit
MLEIKNVSKRFGETQALVDVSLTVQEGETVALLGPSGCGKSTLLGVVGGLLPPDTGTVSWGGKVLNDVPPHARGFGLMFQDYLLFPHLNVAQNVAFGLKIAGWDEARKTSRVAEALALVGLSGFETRDVGSLSGGEQQRAALARALAPEPDVLMLDEPLGALDRALRERLGADLKRILDETGQTALYVTHDQEEAYAMGHRVAVMQAGRIEQVGEPAEVYRAPANAFVARFLGMDNVLDAHIREQNGAVFAETAIGRIRVNTEQRGSASVLLRPDGARLNTGEIQIEGKLLARTFRGRFVQLDVMVHEVELRFDVDTDVSIPAVGEIIVIGLRAADVQALGS